MLTIYKYPLEVVFYQAFLVPEGATLLCIQLQRNIPCIWAKIDTENAKEILEVFTYGTGHIIDTHEKWYLGTYQIEDFVWHVFYRKLPQGKGVG
jgi:hypothetical protein